MMRVCLALDLDEHWDCLNSMARPKKLSIRMVAGHGELAERKEFFGCGGLQPFELFTPAIPLLDASPSGLVNRPLP
jgi:hypothetical protein